MQVHQKVFSLRLGTNNDATLLETVSFYELQNLFRKPLI